MHSLTSDRNFHKTLVFKKEFYDNRIQNDYPDYICLQPYQKLLSNYMSVLTNYNSILINHHVGLGKTLSAISICEGLKDYYRPLILAKNNIIINNFKEEILSDKCSLNVDLNRYAFFTYGDLQKFNVESLKNRVIIIDEAHNITNNNYYKTIMGILKKSKNIKLVLLSATPVFDNLIEVFHILNLLNIVDKNYIFPYTLAGLKKEKYIKVNKDVENEEQVVELTKKGEGKIKELITGKVSFLRSDDSNFPKKIIKGSSINNDNKSLKVFKTKLTHLQKKVYKKNIDNSGVLYKNLSDISTMVYPDETFGSEGFTKWKNIKITKDQLKKCSSKLYTILEEIEKTDGIVFIFSNFVNNGGTSLIKKILNDNGYSKYGNRLNTKKYFSFDESISPNKKTSVLKIINSVENKKGKLIKIIIGSPLVSEGLTFKNIRQIHVLEPYWNLSRIDQVVGRGVRFKSHEDLPPSDRNVEIFLHTAVLNLDSDNTIDMYKYKITQMKDYNIKKIEHIFKTNSIDCFFTKPRNQLKNEHDFTRECQYQKCEYMCPYEEKIPLKTVKDTYNIYFHGKEEYDFIQNAILAFFKNVHASSAKMIVNHVKKYEKEKYNKNTVYKNNIYTVLNDIVQKNILFKNSKGDECTLVKINKYYIANPKNNKIYESFYKKLFVKI